MATKPEVAAAAAPAPAVTEKPVKEKKEKKEVPLSQRIKTHLTNSTLHGKLSLAEVEMLEAHLGRLKLIIA